MTALILVLIITAFYAPTADLALFSLTSLGVAVAVIELDMTTALLVFLASSLLSLAFPGLLAAYPFLLFFGPYPLARAAIDRRFNRLPAALIKLVLGNLLAIIAAALFAWPAITGFAGQYGNWIWYVLPAAMQILLLIFDYVLSLLIQFYMLRLHRQKSH